jgi:hypothetical protein
MKTKLTILSIGLSLIYLPLSFYLSYLILTKIDASELMWFLFWFTVPFGIAMSFLTKIIDSLKDD